ncbi:MAG: DUF1553 domain-containing protein [Planctomycetota bacterium]
MLRSYLSGLLTFLLLLLCVQEKGGAADDVAQQVRSILSNRCFACHGPDEEERQGGLRLDVRESFVLPADSGELPVSPGNPEESELLRRLVSEDEFEQMPPPEFGAPLSEDEINLIRKWIQSGAQLPQHWSFVAPSKPNLPPATNETLESWTYHPVDQFVQAKQLEKGLSPSPSARRSELLRRLSLDLIGLPPTPEEVKHFEQNESPEAYTEEVDRLLASPRFGEHWARKWLDLARYADSAGYADDPPRTIWAYRDWVIRSINRDDNIQDFTIDQLAGDLLEDSTQEQIIATAFHRNTLTNNEGGTNNEEFRNVAVVDRVNTTMAVWMGVTMACAQCHTHKYDPFTHEEYFKLFAVFNQSEDADLRNESPTIPIFTLKQQLQKQEWETQQIALKRKLDSITPALRQEFEAWTKELIEPEWANWAPASATAKSGLEILRQPDDSSLLAQDSEKPNGKTDEFELSFEMRPEDSGTTAIRINALHDAGLPGSGPGISPGNGNFVLTNVSATLTPKSEQAPTARFLRIDHPGKSKILSLAEVEVYSGGKNVARQAKATQSSTGFKGPAKLALDGNTSGDYNKDKSTTHTVQSDNPWWEVDLEEPFAIETVKVFNRTDNNLQNRLIGAEVKLLDAERNVVFTSKIASAKDSYTPAVSTAKSLAFSSAFASFEQKDFAASAAIDEDSKSGWAIGGKQGTNQQITLALKSAIEVEAPSTLTVRLSFNSPYEQHILGRFRLERSWLNIARINDWATLPNNLRAIQRMAVSDRTAEQSQKLLAFFGRNLSQSMAPVREQLASIEKRLQAAKPETTVPVMRDLPDSKHRKTFVQIRGNYKSHGQEVTPGTPEVFPPSQESGLNRLGLANWLVDNKNPLTSRVWVNRLWESLFGIGLVRSSEEFGSQGDRPSHPELLDWLAIHFMDSGWDRKAMLRLLVTSQTYQQTSQVTEKNLELDGDNIWLARGPRVRLSAEMVRDQSLAAAGLLSSKMYGQPVRPPQPDLGLTAAFGSSTDWKTSEGEDRYRRGLYTQWRRSNPYPSMVTFDAPSREVCTLRRDRTNTPLQALVTLNDPGFVEAAQALARRVVHYELDDAPVASQIERLFELAVSRKPEHKELSALVALLEEAKLLLGDDPEAAKQLAENPIGPIPEGADSIELAAFTALCNVILNLDEVLMKR